MEFFLHLFLFERTIMARITVQELSERINLDPPIINSFLRTLVLLKKAKIVGSIPTLTRGKGANIYELPEYLISQSEPEPLEIKNLGFTQVQNRNYVLAPLKKH